MSKPAYPQHSMPLQQAVGTAGPSPNARWAVASLSFSILLASMGISIANVGLPTLAHAFGATFPAVQWVVIAYLLAITTLMVSVGRLGDLMGRKRLLLMGIWLFTVASAACGMSPWLGMLIAARAVQGLGAAVMMALTMAFVAQAVPKAKTGSAMGMLATMSAIGTALGPSLGRVLIAAVGWQALCLVNVPLGGLAFWLAKRSLPDEAPTQISGPQAFDCQGALLLALTLAAYALAMTVGRGNWGLSNFCLLAVAATCSVLFVRAQASARNPLIRLSVFRKGGPASQPGHERTGFHRYDGDVGCGPVLSLASMGTASLHGWRCDVGRAADFRTVWGRGGSHG